MEHSQPCSARKSKRPSRSYRDNIKNTRTRIWNKANEPKEYSIECILQLKTVPSSLRKDSLIEEILARTIHYPTDPCFTSKFNVQDPHQQAFKVQLNKLTPTNMQRICANLLELLQGAGAAQLCALIMEKAALEHKYSETYAELCRRLGASQMTFKKDLFSCCRRTFEGLSSESDRKRFQGKVKFIGCLINNQLLPCKVLKKCLEDLMEGGDELEIEGACYMLGTCNWVFGQLKEWTHEYVKQLGSKAAELPSRVKFQVMDLVEYQQLKTIEFSQKESPLKMEYYR